MTALSLPQSIPARLRYPNRKSHIANRKPRAFTLIEMLIVISVIVLSMTLAVPAIRALTGSRSQDAAQNTLSSGMGFVRSEAVALQRVEGIMFFYDTLTDRIKCVAVMETPYQPNIDVAGVTYLDVVPDRDPLYLPTGVSLWTIRDGTPFGATDPFNGARYLGYNAYFGAATNDPAALSAVSNFPGGVILFDSNGRLTVRRYGFRSALTPGQAPPTPMGQMMYSGLPGADTQALQNWPSAAAPQYYIASQIGFCLFDRESFATQVSSATTSPPYTNDPAAKVTVDNWLDANTTPIFVNRYDGTLMRAE